MNSNKETLETELQEAPAPIGSWEELDRHSRAHFTHLTFSTTGFEPLRGTPFVKSAADRITERFRVLDELNRSVDSDGKRTPAGQNIHQRHFTGDKAWFTDSSDDEKHQFRDRLTFPHPETGEPRLFPWHGKLKANQQPLRIHFSWPMRAGEPVYIVYIGPKITKH